MKFIEPSFEILSQDFTRENVLNTIERAARTCYKSEDKICEGSNVKMLNALIKRGHEAMIEHAPHLSVRFICDRGVTHELVRHRHFSFAQESTRYVNYGKSEPKCIIPQWITGDDRKDILNSSYELSVIPKSATERFVMSCIDSVNSYIDLLEKGWTPQQARSVLPNAIKTEIVVTGNVREWRHTFELRTANDAHPQMREIMIPLILKLNEDIPELWNDIIEKNKIKDWKPVYELC